MSCTRTRSRHGAALIITLIILLALMLLGLPFLFSQSMSLSGTRSLQASQTAHIYGISAQNFGSAIANYATQDHWLIKTTPQPWTAIQIYLATFPTTNGTPLLPTTPLSTDQIALDPAAVGFNSATTHALIGASISDESGRISANTLGPIGWTNVLKAANITDWDDSELDPPVSYPFPQVDDGNPTGQLVDAIMILRMKHGPFTKLDDLLAADPRLLPGTPSDRFRPRLSRAELSRLGGFLTFHNPEPGRGLIDLGNIVAECSDNNPTHYLLTDIPENLLANDTWIQSELESNSTTRQRTWAYLGTGVQGAVRYNGLLRNSLMSLAPGEIPIHHSSIQQSNNALGAPGDGLAMAAPPLININEMTTATRKVTSYDTWRPASTPPPFQISSYADLYNLTVNSIPKTGGDLLKPIISLNGQMERQPASLASSGVFRIQSASTVRDSAGNLAAQESRTSIIQAVPQEDTLEVKWNTQQTLEVLSRQRWTSAMETRPNPINRVTDLQPDSTPYLVTNVSPSCGLSPATLPTLADNAGDTSTRATPLHLKTEWRMTFGRDIPVTNGNERKDSRGLLPELTTTNQADDAALETEGIMLKNDAVVAVTLNQNGPQSGPLTRPTAPLGTTQEMSSRHLSFWFKPTSNWSTSTEPISLMEVRMPANRTATLTVDASGNCVDGNGDPGNNDEQNYLGLYFDPKPFQAAPDATIKKMKLLALCLAAPSAEQKNTPNITMGDDITFLIGPNKADLFAGVDERSSAGTFSIASPINVTRRANFSSLLKSNRILYGLILPETGLEKDRWYHLQIALGTGQAGSLALMIDGLPGRDLTSVDDSSLSVKPGDRFIVPALLLAEPTLLRQPAPLTDLEVKNYYFPDSIKVKVPTILGRAGLKVEDLLPQRGMIRIQDEYIRYCDWTLNSNWNQPTLLKNCARGQRQNTQTEIVTGSPSPSSAYQWPTTQRHEIGALVTPGDFHVELEETSTTGTYLYAGSGALVDDFNNGDSDYTSTITGATLIAQWQTWATFSGGITSPGLITFNGGDITLTPRSTVPMSMWPQSGVVRLMYPGTTAKIYYYYDNINGNTLKNLQPITAGFVPITGFDYRGLTPYSPTFIYPNSGPPPIVYLVSLSLDGDQITEVNGRPPFPYPSNSSAPSNSNPTSAACLAQLMTGNGRCEWIRYQTILTKNDSAGAIRSYLINSGGWGWAEDGVAPAKTASIARGQQRSIFSQTYPYRVEAFPPDFNSMTPSTITALSTAANFPSGSKVVPVQTECESLKRASA